MGDSYGAEPSVCSSAHQGALGQPTPRLAIKHGTCPLWVTSGSRGASPMLPLFPKQQTLLSAVGTSV